MPVLSNSTETSCLRAGVTETRQREKGWFRDVRKRASPRQLLPERWSLGPADYEHKLRAGRPPLAPHDTDGRFRRKGFAECTHARPETVAFLSKPPRKRRFTCIPLAGLDEVGSTDCSENGRAAAELQRAKRPGGTLLPLALASCTCFLHLLTATCLLRLLHQLA